MKRSMRGVGMSKSEGCATYRAKRRVGGGDMVMPQDCPEISNERGPICVAAPRSPAPSGTPPRPPFGNPGIAGMGFGVGGSRCCWRMGNGTRLSGDWRGRARGTKCGRFFRPCRDWCRTLPVHPLRQHGGPLSVVPAGLQCRRRSRAFSSAAKSPGKAPPRTPIKNPGMSGMGFEIARRSR